MHSTPTFLHFLPFVLFVWFQIFSHSHLCYLIRRTFWIAFRPDAGALTAQHQQMTRTSSNLTVKRVAVLYTCQNMTQMTSFIICFITTTNDIFQRNRNCVGDLLDHFSVGGIICVALSYNDEYLWMFYANFSVAQTILNIEKCWIFI